jgi:hypothetical protein
LSSIGIIKEIKNGYVTVKIPLPNGFDESSSKIYYISDDGKSGEEFDVRYETINDTRYIVFDTTHFSTYAVVKTSVPNIDNPQTYDGITTYLILGVTSLIGIIALTVYIKKKI